MASNKTRTYISVEDALRDILDSDFEVDSGSEFGDLSSSEEEMIDTGCDQWWNQLLQGMFKVFFFLCV